MAFRLEPTTTTRVIGDLITLKLVGDETGVQNCFAIWDAADHGTLVPPQNTPRLFSSPDLPNGVLASLFQVGQQVSVQWDTTNVDPGNYSVTVTIYQAQDGLALEVLKRLMDTFENEKGSLVKLFLDAPTTNVTLTEVPKPQVTVQMRRAFEDPTDDQALWTAIRKSTNALSFNNYDKFMEVVLCGGDPGDLNLSSPERIAKFRRERDPIKHRLRLPFPDTDAYRQLKVATEVFVMLNCGVFVEHPGFSDDPKDRADESRRYYRALGPGEIERIWNDLTETIHTEGKGLTKTLPYLAIIRRKLSDVAVVHRKHSELLQEEEWATECMAILMRKLTHPCLLELIWSYWHEEGMLAQTMNAITWRFQNRHSPGDRDPLAMLEIDPLRPLNNFIWGYIQDEQHRLTVPRRAYEYDHHYGLNLVGKAVPTVRGADTRSRFLEGFHNLLFLCSIFYKEDDDTTVVADGFPILNALKEVHLLLTQGAHNQYGDLPWTARQEMLMQEWLLARPEFREYLPSRIMVDYPEPWMDRVETMKTLQSWSNTSILHFRDLGIFGEQILLGIRFGAWPSVIEPQFAANWARYWRPEIQGYYHAYRAVTGADLTERPDATLPSLLLGQRLQQQGLPAPGTAALPSPAAQMRLTQRGAARALPRR